MLLFNVCSFFFFSNCPISLIQVKKQLRVISCQLTQQSELFPFPIMDLLIKVNVKTFMHIHASLHIPIHVLQMLFAIYLQSWSFV